MAKDSIAGPRAHQPLPHDLNPGGYPRSTSKRFKAQIRRARFPYRRSASLSLLGALNKSGRLAVVECRATRPGVGRSVSAYLPSETLLAPAETAFESGDQCTVSICSDPTKPGGFDLQLDSSGTWE